jgi:hypothetical protein
MLLGSNVKNLFLFDLMGQVLCKGFIKNWVAFILKPDLSKKMKNS